MTSSWIPATLVDAWRETSGSRTLVFDAELERAPDGLADLPGLHDVRAAAAQRERAVEDRPSLVDLRLLPQRRVLVLQ